MNSFCDEIRKFEMMAGCEHPDAGEAPTVNRGPLQ